MHVQLGYLLEAMTYVYGFPNISQCHDEPRLESICVSSDAETCVLSEQVGNFKLQFFFKPACNSKPLQHCEQSINVSDLFFLFGFGFTVFAMNE